jgi:TolB protein
VISWSPDSSKIIFASSDDNGISFNVYSINPDGSGRTQLSNGGFDFCPVWSPSNNKIVFASMRDGNAEVYSMDTDGSNETNLTNNANTDGIMGALLFLSSLA